MQSLRQSSSRWATNSLTSKQSGTSFICSSCRSLQQRRSEGSQPSRYQKRAFASDTKPTSINLPSLPASTGHAHLSSRRLISLTGSGAPQFLQGLVTTSIPGGNASTIKSSATEEAAADRNWSYCGFLNATGRVLHDVFIYPVCPGGVGSQDPAYMIEVDATRLPELLRHIRRYKLRSKIAFRAIEPDELGVWQVWDDVRSDSSSLIPALEKLPEGTITALLPDYRAPKLGWRVLSPNLDRLMQEHGSSELVDEDVYKVRRYLHGVPEGATEIIPEHALPSESNMDLMEGVDFRKGCYVGQELTIRTRHRGVVRKRILPVMLYDNDGSSSSPSSPTGLIYNPNSTIIATADLQGATIGRVNRAGRSAGTFLAGVGNIGLALCRLQIMTDLAVPGETTATAATAPFDPAMEFFLKTDRTRGEGEEISPDAVEQGKSKQEGPRVKAFVPTWLRTKLKEEAVALQARHHGS
ncbi:hypothetical protein F5Y16DRAFT_363193 [Xylariaceae sp. FL0255]|nr:hypothetical protein F5Y16DRAFT_363193 [Xylariaceae sp. FL0255]